MIVTERGSVNYSLVCMELIKMERKGVPLELELQNAFLCKSVYFCGPAVPLLQIQNECDDVLVHILVPLRLVMNSGGRTER